MTNILSRSRKTNFQLVFPVLPHQDNVDEQSDFRLNIFGSVLPGIQIQPQEFPWQGGKVYGESGDIEYKQWNTSFLVDQDFNNYITIYEWMMSIIDGYNNFGSKFEDYQIDSSLLIFNNWEENILTFKFKNIWPSDIGDIELSYQEGEELLKCDITFTYDWFSKVKDYFV